MVWPPRVGGGGSGHTSTWRIAIRPLDDNRQRLHERPCAVHCPPFVESDTPLPGATPVATAATPDVVVVSGLVRQDVVRLAAAVTLASGRVDTARVSLATGTSAVYPYAGAWRLFTGTLMLTRGLPCQPARIELTARWPKNGTGSAATTTESIDLTLCPL